MPVSAPVIAPNQVDRMTRWMFITRIRVLAVDIWELNAFARYILIRMILWG
jgi:hypothetical protein